MKAARHARQHCEFISHIDRSITHHGKQYAVYEMSLYKQLQNIINEEDSEYMIQCILHNKQLLAVVIIHLYILQVGPCVLEFISTKSSS